VIEGADAFTAGTTDSVAGLEAPDPHTLLVHLTRPTGDVAYLFAFPDSSPTPPGADQGHESDYWAFLVASGPYMYEGAEEVDYSLPAAQQTAARGAGATGGPMVLIRNPSWDRSGDPLRPAYPDRIEISFGDSPEAAAAGVDKGTIDMVLDYRTIAPASQIERYQADEELQPRVHVTPNDSVSFLSMNVAAPPFDDVQVRRAINLALDKQALRELAGGATAGTVATHVAPDSLEGNLLLNYDPYPSEEQRGDIAAAKDEMAQSRYDTDGDGVCDADACREVSALARSDTFPKPFVDAVARSLDPLGISLRTEIVDDCCSDDPASFYSRLFDPESHIALALGTAYAKDFTSASSFFERFAGASQDISLLGATKEQLEQWGYTPIDTPSVDPKIEDCLARLGGEQTQCWAELDQELMEVAVPLVPWLFGATARIVSDRVQNYTIDQWSALPAFDRIALEPGAQ
jgi:peptide/nickel transport system substrate-binding protein